MSLFSTLASLGGPSSGLDDSRVASAGASGASRRLEVSGDLAIGDPVNSWQEPAVTEEAVVSGGGIGKVSGTMGCPLRRLTGPW